MAVRFNPFTGNLDIIEDDAQESASAPSAGAAGTLYIDASTPTDVYFFSGGHRYRLEAVQDDPASGGAGTPIGLLLALTYS